MASSLTHPLHEHPRRVWLLPDSRLGRWAMWTFAASVVVLALAIAFREPYVDLIGGPDEGIHLVLKLLPLGIGMTLGGISGVLSIVSLGRDHALLLAVPAILGTMMGAFGLGEVLVPH